MSKVSAHNYVAGLRHHREAVVKTIYTSGMGGEQLQLKLLKQSQKKPNILFFFIETKGCPTGSADCVLLLLPNVMEHRSLLVVCFYFYQISEWSPMERRALAQRFITRPVYLRSQFRNNTNTVLL